MTKERMKEIRNAINILAGVSDLEWAQIESACTINDSPKNKTVKYFEKKVNKFLKELRAPINVQGYQYVKDAIIIYLINLDRKVDVTKEVYMPIAKKYNKNSNSSIAVGIKRFKEIVLQDGDEKLVKEMFGRKLVTKEKITNAEFIIEIACYISENC